MTNMAGLESDSVYSTGPSIFDLCYTQFDNLAHCTSFFFFFPGSFSWQLRDVWYPNFAQMKMLLPLWMSTCLDLAKWRPLIKLS